MDIPTPALARRRWTLTGQLQGVGFRPFVYRVAQEIGVTGFVRNDVSAVIVEAQGPVAALEHLDTQLRNHLPPMARLHSANLEDLGTVHDTAFVIAPSQTDTHGRPTIPADIATCQDCRRELSDPADHRFAYPLINCTNCGPRYTIIRAMPYDRVNTTMAPFKLCEKCHQQYLSPLDRRFHAQPVACADCGPHVDLVPLSKASQASASPSADGPIAQAARLIAQGQILAIKGIGGFHLACRADDASVIRELRARKKRDSKPFALMCANLDVAKGLVELSDQAIAELTSPAAPIVLARPANHSPLGGTTVLNQIAKGTHRLGVILPYSPIHHLLFASLNQQSSINMLVMTSANVTDEPLVKDNAQALSRLSGIADAVLLHDRDIERSVDDSVIIDLGPTEPLLPIRRARGYVPQVIRLNLKERALVDGLCVGGELKNTVAVVRGDEVILSHHLGDLKHALAYDYFRKAIDDLCRLMEVKPQWIAHDLHPAYLSTQWARELSQQWNVPLVGVQHHHAHAAAVLAEHGVREPALAIVCDGVGYGTDGAAWGGELLKLDGPDCQRLGHLRPIWLAGGDAAARDTRRCAAGVLHELGDDPSTLFSGDEAPMIIGMLQSHQRCVRSSAAGRLFDAAASLLGICSENTHEAEAAMALENLAAQHVAGRNGYDDLALAGTRAVTEQAGNWIIDLLPHVAALHASMLNGEPAAKLAWDFHAVFAQAWAAAAIQASRRTRLNLVALSGGVFCNEILTKLISRLLTEAGLRVLRHQVVPPNDGGISLGQAAVAIEQLQLNSTARAPRRSTGPK